MGNYLRLIRPGQWIKNVFVLAGPAFGLRFFEANALLALLAFCLVAGASYAINDVLDRQADRAHPEKRNRPVASGAISPVAAVATGLVLAAAALALTHLFLPRLVTAIVGGYFLLVLSYSAFLKERPILDVIIIAAGFVLRAVAGAAAVEVPVSPWLIVCTFTLCLFLGFGKRRCELAAFTNQDDARAHRATLVRYTPELLNHLTSVSAGIAIVTFLIYTMDTNPRIPYPPFRKDLLLYTLPLVAYALFRYAMLVESGRFAGPSEIVARDRGLLLTGLLWVLAAGTIIFLTKGSGEPGQAERVPADGRGAALWFRGDDWSGAGNAPLWSVSAMHGVTRV